MLSQLYIENFAVIKELTIDFTTGFNVFTGETGAGKTMLIHAINAVLGKRIPKDYVRNGEQRAIVSAKFDNLSEMEMLACTTLGYECEEELLITRDITNEGKSSCKINGRPATLAILSEITKNLIIIHGQHDNGIFINQESELAFLDNYGDYMELLKEYSSLYVKYRSVEKELRSIHLDTSLKEQKLDLLKYQIQEIESAEIVVGEAEELLAQRKKIKNSEKIVTLLNSATELVKDSDFNIIDQLESLTSNLSEISKYLDSYEDIAQKCQEMVYEVQEIGSNFVNDLESFDFEPTALDEIEDRLELLRKLKRKYGNSEEEILLFLDNASNELEKIETSDERSLKLEHELVTLEKELCVKAKNITVARTACSKDFIQKVKDELTFLNMPNVELAISLESKEKAPDGQDIVHFLLSTNPGEPPKPIHKIASGGEISRIMLAIKNVMADKDNVSTLIFDEVDTGVSGVAAQKIGQKLKQVSKSHQVICITHLAQVASFGDTHFKIFKDFSQGQTYTCVDTIVGKVREEELAKIIVGENITDAALKSAREMLNLNNK